MAGCEVTSDCYYDGVIVDCGVDYCIDECEDADGNIICTDTASDDFNCGACGYACGDGEYCWYGACAAGTCEDAGYYTCGDMCSDLTDDLNCGECYNECALGCDTVNLVCF
jgi:hypothetical protein